MEITATSGTLKLSLKAEDTLATDVAQSSSTVSDVLNIEGKLDVVNQLLAGTMFSPACEEVDRGKITLLVKVLATGPLGKT